MNTNKLSMMLILVLANSLLTRDLYAEKKPILKFNPAIGEKFTLIRTVDSSVEHNLGNEKQNLTNHMTTEFVLEPKSVDANGIYSVLVTVRSMKSNSAGPGYNNVFDSTDPNKNSLDPVIPFYNAIIAQQITTQIDSKGDVITIEGLDELYSKMTDQIIAADKIGRRQGKPVLRKTFKTEEKTYQSVNSMLKILHSRENLESILKTIIMPLPAEPLKKSLTWSVKNTYSVPNPIAVENTYKITELDDSVAAVDVNGVIDPNVPVPFSRGVTQTTGTYKGTATLDKKTGLVINLNINTELDSQYRTTPTQQVPKQFIIPMKAKTKITVERLDTNKKINS